jgi:NAD(P)-dependent dehydrogenase (short-subunit alcohol dehydrogenase family)
VRVKGIAEQFLLAGARVIINGRTTERMEGTVKDLVETQGYPPERIYSALGDVSTAEGVTALCDRVDTIGEIDVLVCNVRNQLITANSLEGRAFVYRWGYSL